MKKAVADLAPTLPVKVIGFSCKSAFYADFSHDMYVSGGCRPKASDCSVARLFNLTADDNLAPN